MTVGELIQHLQQLGCPGAQVMVKGYDQQGYEDIAPPTLHRMALCDLGWGSPGRHALWDPTCNRDERDASCLAAVITWQWPPEEGTG